MKTDVTSEDLQSTGLAGLRVCYGSFNECHTHNKTCTVHQLTSYAREFYRYKDLVVDQAISFLFLLDFSCLILIEMYFPCRRMRSWSL